MNIKDAKTAYEDKTATKKSQLIQTFDSAVSKAIANLEKTATIPFKGRIEKEQLLGIAREKGFVASIDEYDCQREYWSNIIVSGWAQ